MPREPLAWAPFAPETFARAKAERKFVVLDGSAEWCHWCHVMEDESFDDSPLVDPVDLPRDQAPSWVVTMMIVSAVTCVLVAGYYLLR